MSVNLIFCLIIALSCIFGALTADCDVSGAPVTVEGFIVDNYCIGLGFFPDTPQFKPLQNPEEHTMYCLVDVKPCTDSGFVILADPPTSGGNYTIKYQLGTEGTEKAIKVANEMRAHDVSKGLHATVTGVDDGSPELKCIKFRSATSPHFPYQWKAQLR